jgi:uncharacterized protein (TIGR00251 family)
MKLEQKDGGLLLRVKVVPNSSRTQVAGVLGDALKVKVAQPAEGGRANRAVIELLASVLGVPAGQIALVSGQTSPRKVFRISGVAREVVEALLGAAGGSGEA